jgi:hypothetical protein
MVTKQAILGNKDIQAIKHKFERNNANELFDNEFNKAYNQTVTKDSSLDDSIFKISLILLEVLKNIFPKAAKSINLIGTLGQLLIGIFKKKKI